MKFIERSLMSSSSAFICATSEESRVLASSKSARRSTVSVDLDFSRTALNFSNRFFATSCAIHVSSCSRSDASSEMAKVFSQSAFNVSHVFANSFAKSATTRACSRTRPAHSLAVCSSFMLDRNSFDISGRSLASLTTRSSMSRSRERRASRRSSSRGLSRFFFPFPLDPVPSLVPAREAASAASAQSLASINAFASVARTHPTAHTSSANCSSCAYNL